VEYGVKEVSDNPNSSSEQLSTLSIESTNAKYLHKISKSQTVRTKLIYEDDAITYASRTMFIRGERSGEISLQSKNKFFNSNIGDIIKVDRIGQCGFSYIINSKNTRYGLITETDKNLRSITIKINDIKGVEDNALNW
jgi:hypothetical protein